MTWLEDVGECLQSRGIGTLATDIFYTKFPAQPYNCILLMGQAGQSTKTTLRKTMTLERPELGIRVRNQDDETADANAKAIYDLLNLTFNATLGSTRFKSIKAIAPHFSVGQDKNENFLYSINFSLEIG